MNNDSAQELTFQTWQLLQLDEHAIPPSLPSPLLLGSSSSRSAPPRLTSWMPFAWKKTLCWQTDTDLNLRNFESARRRVMRSLLHAIILGGIKSELQSVHLSLILRSELLNLVLGGHTLHSSLTFYTIDLKSQNKQIPFILLWKDIDSGSIHTAAALDSSSFNLFSRARFWFAKSSIAYT